MHHLIKWLYSRSPTVVSILILSLPCTFAFSSAPRLIRSPHHYFQRPFTFISFSGFWFHSPCCQVPSQTGSARSLFAFFVHITANLDFSSVCTSLQRVLQFLGGPGWRLQSPRDFFSWTHRARVFGYSSWVGCRGLRRCYADFWNGCRFGWFCWARTREVVWYWSRATTSKQLFAAIFGWKTNLLWQLDSLRGWPDWALRVVGDGKADFFGFDGDSKATQDKERLNYHLNSARLGKRANFLAI